MCIAEQRVTKDELFIKLADGRQWSITRQGVLDIYAAQSGNAAARKAATITAVKNQIVAAFGAALIDANLLTVDFNPTDANAHMQLASRT